MDTMTEPRFRRPTRVKMVARLDAILDIVEEIEPCSVRQAFLLDRCARTDGQDRGRLRQGTAGYPIAPPRWADSLGVK